MQVSNKFYVVTTIAIVGNPIDGDDYYVKPDLVKGRPQAEVDDDFKELLTPVTCLGLFLYRGSNAVTVICQQIMDTKLTEVSGVAADLGDIAVMDSSPDDL
ncbi:hypothetical protein P879_06196 [Paragonimus westermani]|uniref:Uncharacterized protein n=1 Tax=Paragonimus westermani TaxID=34504 RepID=A0A8T0DA83_9TREM|nr:hypothetical protein P879_06196 [Paragonimus westermani]